MDVEAILAAANVRHDEYGNPIVVTARCGRCGREWNDAAGSSLTPAPAARCPWEMDDDAPCWGVGDDA